MILVRVGGVTTEKARSITQSGAEEHARKKQKRQSLETEHFVIVTSIECLIVYFDQTFQWHHDVCFQSRVGRSHYNTSVVGS